MRTLSHLWHALTGSFHSHICGCGESFLCSRRACEREPYTCIDCDTKQMAQWAIDYEARHPRRKERA